MPITCQPYSTQSFYTVRERLRTMLRKVSKPQLTNLSLLTFGLFAAGNCQLPRIAAKLPLLTGAASLTQRLRRLLMNSAIKPAKLYQPVAGFLLACFTGGSVRLILDATDLGGRLPVLFVAIAYRGRALPLAWRMLPAPGCSEFREQKALLTEVAADRSGCPRAAFGRDNAAGRPRIWQRRHDPLVPLTRLALLSACHPNKTLRRTAGCWGPRAQEDKLVHFRLHRAGGSS